MSKYSGRLTNEARFIRLGKLYAHKDKVLSEKYFQVARDLRAQINAPATQNNEIIESINKGIRYD